VGTRTITAAIKPSYRRTEAKYKGGAHEIKSPMIWSREPAVSKTAVYPKVKKVSF